MRLFVGGCRVCHERGKFQQDDMCYIELRDDSYYEVQCAEGHTSWVIFQVDKFEILFESGAMALLDGYTREAVSSFAASLERFFEYWIRATLLDSGVAPETIEDGWKVLARQSERQYGAFCALYQREFGRPPMALPNSRVEFRNEVIHKGLVPTRSDVEEYASDVLQMIAGLWCELSEKKQAGISKLIGINLWKARSRVPDPMKMSTMVITTTLSHVVSSKGKMGFHQALKELERRREILFRH